MTSVSASEISNDRGTALVTGASSGIGEDIARRLARAGYDLILVARREVPLRDVASRISREHRVRAEWIAVDLAEPDAAQRIAERVRLQGSDVEILINNAGYGIAGAFSEVPERSELDMLQVNIMALVQLTKLFLPAMITRRRGRIMNLASTAAFAPGPFMAGYYASKAFVLSFSQAVGAELRGTGVTVTVVCPGPTNTNFAKRAGVTETALFRTGSMSASVVADQAVAAMMAGKSLVVTGLRNKLLAIGSRLAPRSIVLRITRRLNETRT
jgi:short-subunit dehydrogenase